MRQRSKLAPACSFSFFPRDLEAELSKIITSCVVWFGRPKLDVCSGFLCRVERNRSSSVWLSLQATGNSQRETLAAPLLETQLASTDNKRRPKSAEWIVSVSTFHFSLFTFHFHFHFHFISSEWRNFYFNFNPNTRSSFGNRRPEKEKEKETADDSARLLILLRVKL